MALIPLPEDAQLDGQQAPLTPLPDHVALDQPNGAPATIDDTVRASTGRSSVYDRVSSFLGGTPGGAQDTFMANYIPGGKYALAGTKYLAQRMAHPVQAATELYNGVTGRSGQSVSDLIAGRKPNGLPSFGDDLKDVSKDLNSYSDDHPVMSGVMSTAGLLTNPVFNRLAGAVGEAVPQVAKTANSALQVASKYGRYGLQGGTVGAVTAALNATGADGGLPTINDIVNQTSWGGGLGAATGIAAPVVAKVASNAIGKVAQLIGDNAPNMTQAQIKAASTAAYKTASDAGVVVKPDAFTNFTDDLVTQIQKDGFDGGLHPSAAAVLKRLSAEADNVAPKTLDDLEILRRVANSGVKSAVRSGSHDEVRIANKVVDGIDDFIGGLDQSKVLGGDPDIAVPALQEARKLWRVNAKLQNVSDILDTAENLGDPNYIKSQFRSIVRNPRKFGQYSAAEQATIKRIAKTGTLDAIGKLAPSLDTMGVLKGLGYLSAGAVHPPAMMLPVAGMAAKGVAGLNRAANITDLQNSIISRAIPSATPQPSFAPNFSGNAFNSYAKGGNLLNVFAKP